MSESTELTGFDRWLCEEVPAEVQAHVVLGMPLEKLVIEMMQWAWDAGAADMDRTWRQHILRGLRDDHGETVVHMMQRWG